LFGIFFDYLVVEYLWHVLIMPSIKRNDIRARSFAELTESPRYSARKVVNRSYLLPSGFASTRYAVRRRQR
jgi:hypothetical protein